MAQFDAFGKLQFNSDDLFRKPTDTGVKSDSELESLKELIKKTESLKAKPVNYDSKDITAEELSANEDVGENYVRNKYMTQESFGKDDPTKMAKNMMVGRGPAEAMGAYGDSLERIPDFQEGNAPTVDPDVLQPDLSLDDYNPPVEKSAQQAPEMKEAFATNVATPVATLEQALQQSSPQNLPAMSVEKTPQQSSLQEKLSLLEQYKKLTEQKQNTNRNLDMLMGGNQIAQAIASGYGGKIGDGSEAVNQLRKSAELPVEGLLGQTKAIDAQTELEMADPASDISKFARERATANATKMGLQAEDLKRLENMSAKQLEKLGLFKNDLAANQASKLGLYYTTIRDDKTGQDRVVGINRQTGEVVNDIGGKTYADKIIENKQTGQTEVYKQGAGVNTLDKSNTQTPEEAAKKQEETKTEYSSPTALNKVNPKLYKKFTDLQGDFSKDMKESRETATAVTNLAAKLQPGQNMKIDSGLLGGIQTQAAKMAGQKGVLTDQDLVKFAGAGGVSAAIDRLFSGNFEGEMSEQDVNFFKAFAKKMEGSLAEDINNRSKLYSGQILNEAKDYLPGLTEDNVATWLQVSQVAPAVQQKTEVASDKVKVKLPNGTIGTIPKVNLKQALDKGAVEVK